MGESSPAWNAPWTEEELRWAVATSTSLRQVMARLGYPASGSRWSKARAQILALGLDTSHFGMKVQRVSGRPGGPGRSWSDDDLREAVANSRSVAGVLRHLGLQPGGEVYVTVQRRMRDLGLDRSHFTGKGWRRGTFTPVKPGRPLEEILVEDSPMLSTAHLRKRLLREQVFDPVCSSCGRTEWNGQPIPLQLDHINGDRTDNRLSNLRLLCPNCHALTETWCSKNRGRYDRLAPVLELVYRPRSKWGAFGHEGSTPSGRTIQLTFGDLDDLD
jgi:hypothetical protein